MKISNNTILITGGASGIGKGLTERFLQENNKVIICGRRMDVLEEMAKQWPGLIIRQCDVEVAEDRVALFEWVSATHPDVNVLVNNAGIQHWMNVTDADFFTKAKQEITINIEAPLHLISLFLQHPALQVVMNTTSGLSFAPLSKVPVYSATKAFFHSFTLSLRYLLQSRNIEVVEIIPPALNTDLGGKGIHNAFPPVSEFIESIFAQLKEGSSELTFGTSVKRPGLEEIKQSFAQMNP